LTHLARERAAILSHRRKRAAAINATAMPTRTFDESREDQPRGKSSITAQRFGWKKSFTRTNQLSSTFTKLPRQIAALRF
jgi:hypothetical protein